MGQEINRQLLVISRNEWRGQWLEQFKDYGSWNPDGSNYLFPWVEVGSGVYRPLILMPRGTVTKAIVGVWGGAITAGTVTFTLQHSTEADFVADGDIDTWTDIGELGVASKGHNGERNNGLSLDVDKGDCLRIKTYYSVDFTGSPNSSTCQMFFKPRTN
jgi:hypothetical protein